ncbi:hypothetical protein AB0O77_23835 [Streptomyces albidoflavus]|uniref:hypothetical protein n=1 Tax=Streptomyces albidoflavus TaxID=1886 RepID=UPI00342B9BAF
MSTAVRTPPHHNALTCYTDYQCRRPECVDRYNARNRERLQAQKAGTWTGLIDAEPVRQHILQLGTVGISPSDIAATADTSIQSVLEFIRPVRGRGRRHRTSPAMAARILAVGPDNVVRAVVDATATQRRLQALAALGWPMKHTALHAGLSTTNITSIFARSRVTAATEQAIADAYDQMRRQRPENHRVSRGQAKKTRRWAAAARWPKPSYWDQHPDGLGDPHFQPLYKVTPGELVAEDARWLLTGGVSMEHVAERLGKTTDYITQVLRQHPGGTA